MNRQNGKRRVNDDSDQELQILAPKEKASRPAVVLKSYPHVDNWRGIVRNTRNFSRYLHRCLNELGKEAFNYPSMMSLSSENDIFPPFLEKCSLSLESEMISIRELFHSFSMKMERLEDVLLSFPFPPRDGIREYHPLNSIEPKVIALALMKAQLHSPLPDDMKFNREQMATLKEDIASEQSIETFPLRDKEVPIPQPLEDYSQEAGGSGAKDKRFKGREIMNSKDGVVKLSYPSYHLKVMNLLATNGIFGKVYNPYKKSYQKVVYATIASIHGDEMVDKIINFLQASYSAYETIFIEGKRSLFGPADVETDVKQHLAQIVHYFKSNVSSEALLT